MIKKIIIDGQEFNTPAQNFKHRFTTAGIHKLDTLYVPANLVNDYKDSRKTSQSNWAKQILPISE